MNPLYVFYHFFSPPVSGSPWTWPLDQQLQLLVKSGLSDHARVGMCITGEIDIDYLHRRYPFVDVIDIRSVDQPNIFEGQTLWHVYTASRYIPESSYVLYMHNKGCTSNSPYVSAWRETLNHEMITKWRKCYDHLYDNDVVGVSDTHVLNSGSVITSGNFWWARSSYLKTLPDPIDSTQYLDKHHPTDYDYRYCFERWITTNKPSLYFTCDMNVNPYLEYYFIEEHR